MSLIEQELVRAEENSTDARKRLAQTMVALQSRLKPSALARDAVEELREAAGELAQAGMDAAKRKPLAVAGTVAAFGAFLARKPLARLFRRKPDKA